MRGGGRDTRGLDIGKPPIPNIPSSYIITLDSVYMIDLSSYFEPENIFNTICLVSMWVLILFLFLSDIYG